MDVIQFFNSKLQEQMEHVCPSYDRLTYKQQKQTTYCIKVINKKPGLPMISSK